MFMIYPPIAIAVLFLLSKIAPFQVAIPVTAPYLLPRTNHDILSKSAPAFHIFKGLFLKLAAMRGRKID